MSVPTADGSVSEQESITKGEAISQPAAIDDPRLRRVTEELAWISDRLSTQARVIAVGALAVVWAVLSGDVDDFNPNHQRLTLLAIAAVVLLVIDFLQYLAGYWQSWFRLRAIQRQVLSERQVPSGKRVRLLFWIREACFHLKWILVIITSVLLITTASSALSPEAGSTPAKSGSATRDSRSTK